MSNILHFSIWDKKGKVKLAQLDTQKSKDIFNKIEDEIKPILKSSYPDKVDFDKYYITYLTNTGVLYLVVTKRDSGSSLPERFLDQAVSKLQDSINLDQLESKSNLCLQQKLNGKINELLSNFDTGLNNSGGKIAQIEDDVAKTKNVLKENIKEMVDNQDNMDELLEKSNDLKKNAKEYEKTSDEVVSNTRIYKKLWFIITCAIVLLVIIYFIAALARCKSANLFCKK